VNSSIQNRCRRLLPAIDGALHRSTRKASETGTHTARFQSLPTASHGGKHWTQVVQAAGRHHRFPLQTSGSVFCYSTPIPRFQSCSRHPANRGRVKWVSAHGAGQPIDPDGATNTPPESILGLVQESQKCAPKHIGVLCKLSHIPWYSNLSGHFANERKSLHRQRCSMECRCAGSPFHGW